MPYNFMEFPSILIGFKNSDSTQNVSVYNKDGVTRTVVSTPEKIDEFISETKKGKRSEVLRTFITVGIGIAAGLLTAFGMNKIIKTPFDKAEKILASFLGADAGLITGIFLPNTKKLDKAIAKLTEGVPQEPAAQPAAPAPAVTKAATASQTSGFNNLLKAAQQQQI